MTLNFIIQFAMSFNNVSVPFHQQDRQWDLRVNVPTQSDVDRLLGAVQREWVAGKFSYVLVGGIEIGDLSWRDDYEIRHVHVALMYTNRVTKASILKNLEVKQGNGYYLVPRNRDLPYAGWRAHHIKEKTKIDGSRILFEEGRLPEDRAIEPAVKRSEVEKKRKLDDIIIEMRHMIEEGKDEEAFQKFPRNYITYGEKLKAMVHQKRDFFKSNGDPHLWVFGSPGDGKSALMQVVYPNNYNKNMDNKFFDLYKPEVHTHMLLQDVDHAIVERLGVQFLKTICDEAGFPVDAKYKTPQLARTCVLVTSNFRLYDVLPEDMKGRNENLQALNRRFFTVNIRTLLQHLGLKMLSKYELAQLKREGNQDPRKLFLTWDYARDCPVGEPLADASFYQGKIKDMYYGVQV